MSAQQGVSDAGENAYGQLQKFVTWERENNPGKRHVADWALREIDRLRADLIKLSEREGVLDARPMDTAPRDGSLVCLLVDATENRIEDADRVWTIGANSFDNTGNDEWQFAGWSWEQDVFTQGEGTPVGWLPFPHAASALPKQEGEPPDEIIDALFGSTLRKDEQPSAQVVTDALIDEAVNCAWHVAGTTMHSREDIKAAVTAIYPMFVGKIFQHQAVAVAQQSATAREIRIVCEWRNADLPVFVEAETADGQSVSLPWHDRPNGLKELRLYDMRALRPVTDKDVEHALAMWDAREEMAVAEFGEGEFNLARKLAMQEVLESFRSRLAGERAT